jgi:hypothetical protein
MTLSLCEEGAAALNAAAEGPVKDRQTVSPEGEPISRRIAGVIVHRRPLQEDERGELVEIYSPEWGIHSQPLVCAYFVSIRPNQVKGWVLHTCRMIACFFCAA